jgi:hypothetical protein
MYIAFVSKFEDQGPKYHFPSSDETKVYLTLCHLRYRWKPPIQEFCFAFTIFWGVASRPYALSVPYIYAIAQHPLKMQYWTVSMEEFVVSTWEFGMALPFCRSWGIANVWRWQNSAAAEIWIRILQVFSGFLSCLFSCACEFFVVIAHVYTDEATGVVNVKSLQLKECQLSGFWKRLVGYYIFSVTICLYCSLTV